MAPRFQFLITGTDTGVGKTTFGCLLASSLQRRGLRVGVMKPAETGCESRNGELIPLDAIALRDAASSTSPMNLVCPYRYTTPLAPAAAADVEACPPPDLNGIRSAYEKLAADSDVMLVEGAGGITVPITWHENYADLALMLNLELILVVANRLGCLNATILTLDYAARRGVRIKGYVLNHPDDDRSPAVETNVLSLRHLTAVECLGQIAYRGSLDPELCSSLLT